MIHCNYEWLQYDLLRIGQVESRWGLKLKQNIHCRYTAKPK